MRTTRAPVAQLDRALPSEGRGREFESRRVRQFILVLNTLDGDHNERFSRQSAMEAPRKNGDPISIAPSRARRVMASECIAELDCDNVTLAGLY